MAHPQPVVLIRPRSPSRRPPEPKGALQPPCGPTTSVHMCKWPWDRWLGDVTDFHRRSNAASHLHERHHLFRGVDALDDPTLCGPQVGKTLFHGHKNSRHFKRLPLPCLGDFHHLADMTSSNTLVSSAFFTLSALAMIWAPRLCLRPNHVGFRRTHHSSFRRRIRQPLPTPRAGCLGQPHGPDGQIG